ncbi:hypothetical protein HHI36_004805 [Cryptolaemus montrouzieri]|uniref:Uncharacterized protein n=1 Tax=Cryptolaemus montrouzieri TaxID=559131 RepID=A0ABD2NSB1_9CUCU
MRVNIEIGSRVFRYEVIAADITEEVILGMDVIKRYGFNLDLKKDVLRIDNEEIPFSDTGNDVLKVHLCEDVTLPSLSETVVMARHDGNMEKVSTCLMEPCVDSPLGKGLAVGKILVKMKENVPVRILNVNSFPVTLKRDTVIAESKPVCEVIGTVTSPASSSRNKCPQQLLDLLSSSCHDLDNPQTIRVRQLIEEYHDVFATDDDKTGKLISYVIRSILEIRSLFDNIPEDCLWLKEKKLKR